jgi:hypothetical protein
MTGVIFWDMTPCSPLSLNRRFGGTYCLHFQGRRNKFSKKSSSHLLVCWVFAELISSNLKMEAICSFETSVEPQRTTRCHIPEDDTLRYSCSSCYSSPCWITIPRSLRQHIVLHYVYSVFLCLPIVRYPLSVPDLFNDIRICYRKCPYFEET